MAKNQYQLVTFFLNGKEVERMIDVRASLTDMLRNDFSMTSVKKGCEVGECGACNVLIDGECYNSCLYLAVWAEGKHITTLEGLMGPNGELSDIQQAFMEETSIQCGFCIPGFIMTAVEILDRGVYYTDDQLRKLLQDVAGRRIGYVSPVLDNLPMGSFIPAEVQIGGVIVLDLKIDHYEEIG